MDYLPHKFKDAFLPRVTDKYLAIQTLRISHQCPAHLSSEFGDGFDVLLIHRVDTWSIQRIQIFKLVLAMWYNLAVLNAGPHGTFKVPGQLQGSIAMVGCVEPLLHGKLWVSKP